MPDHSDLPDVPEAVAGGGGTATVRGYVVGQPTATNTVVRSDYPSDYALAIADTAAETGTTRMIYVQISTAHRSGYGLKSNPSLLGKQIDVTGTLGAYFSHPGLTSTTAFATVGGSTPPSGIFAPSGGPGVTGTFDPAARRTAARASARPSPAATAAPDGTAFPASGPPRCPSLPG